jgi:hypothetical protein
MKTLADSVLQVERLLSDFEGSEVPRRYKRAIYIIVALLCLYAVGRGVVAAKRKPLWFDEFCTLAIAGQPGEHEIWKAVKLGFDSSPPLFYFVEGSALKLEPNKQIALRIPSILAFPCTLICVFVYARKFAGELVACLSALLLLSTSLFHRYAIEARSYGIMIACVAFALVCYQRLPSIRWAALLGFSLVLAESLHYYAVLAMIPFWVAETVALLKTRQIRWSVWIALASGLVPLAVCWPLLSIYRTSYVGHVVSFNPSLSSIPSYYGSYFFVNGALGIALGVVSIVAIAWAISWPRNGVLQRGTCNTTNLVEITLLVSLVALPVLASVPVRLAHGIWGSRYLLAATIGIVLGISYALSVARPRTIVLFGLFILASVCVREFTFWRYSTMPDREGWSIELQDGFGQIQGFVENGGHLDLPVVIGQGLVYTQLAYYSPPSWSRRLVYLTDAQKEFNYDGNDLVVRVLSRLQEFMPLRLADYSEFIAAHREFLLFSQGEEWALVNLRRDAVSLELLGIEDFSDQKSLHQNWRLYLVKMDERLVSENR